MVERLVCGLWGRLAFKLLLLPRRARLFTERA